MLEDLQGDLTRFLFLIIVSVDLPLILDMFLWIIGFFIKVAFKINFGCLNTSYCFEMTFSNFEY